MSITEIFDYDSIKNCINILTENSMIEVKNIEYYPKVRECYEYIYKFINSTNKDELYIKIYDNMLKIILKQYRPGTIYPDTIGSFIFGCFQQNYGDVDSLCSPLCSGSIQKSSYDGSISCKNQIWLQLSRSDIVTIESRFGKLGSKCKSPNAYIYVDKTFDGFTLSELNYFKRFGVTSAQVMVTDNLKHHIIYKMGEVSSLPLLNNYDGVITSYTFTDRSDISTETLNENNTWVYIAVSIAFVFIALYVYKQGN